MNMTRKTVIGSTLSLALVATAGFAASHASVANKTVAARHAQMTMISYHTGVLAGVAKGETPYDSAVVDAAAANLSALAKMAPQTLWIEGTEQGAVDGSRAKAEIWSDPAGFAEKFMALADASDAMMGAANAAAVGAGMAGIGGACKACHETYRGPKE